MIEYLIRRADGEWFDLPTSQFAEALRPSSYPSERISGWGSHRIRTEGVEVAFSEEDPGIQVIFEGDLPRATTDKIVAEIFQYRACDWPKGAIRTALGPTEK